jgi:uncharacterized protein YqfA (UPF0365 family)
MDAAEFVLLQNALMWSLGPIALWMAALLIAGGVFAGIFVVIMALLRKITSTPR